MYKIKSFVLLILVLLASKPSSAQQPILDSLYTLWQDPAQNDSVRTDAFRDYIVKGFLYSNPDTAAILADKLIAFGKKQAYPKAQASGLRTSGISYWVKGDYPKAMDYYTRSLKIYEQLGDQHGIASSLLSIGNIYNSQGDYPNALSYYTQSLKIHEQLGDQPGKGKLISNIGIIYYFQGDYPKALSYYTRSLEIREQLSDQHGISISLNNIGEIYHLQGDYPKALDCFTRSLKIREQLSYQQGISTSLNNIGLIYKDQGVYPKALDYYTRSLKIKEQLGDQHGIASSLMSIGNIYNLRGNYPKAQSYCQKGYNMALSIGVLEEQKNACQCLYDSYKAMGKGNEALEYLEKMNAVSDSLHSKETAKQLQQMEFAKVMLQDSIAKAEEGRLIDEAHKEEVRQKNQTRNYLAAAGFLFLLLSGGLYSRWRYVRNSRAVLQVEKDRSENLLLNILPADIAEELKQKGKAEPRNFDLVSILFTDFKGFTEQSSKLSATVLVGEINVCFEAFDATMAKHGIEKIKTIGDAYMAAGGLPVPTNDSIKNTVLAALEMQTFITNRKAEMDAQNKPAFEMRVGIHTGPVVAGIVGVKKFQYDIWGDTVNTAARIESAGEAGKVNISQTTFELLKTDSDFSFISRGKIQAKGKGEIEMYFVSKSKAVD